MKLNRAERRKASKLGLEKCPVCGAYKVGRADSFKIDGVEGELCFDCGCKLSSTRIKESSKVFAILSSEGYSKELHLVDSIKEAASFMNCDESWRPEIVSEYGNPVLWFVKGSPGSADRQVKRCGTLLKGIENCSEFIKKLNIDDLVEDASGVVESEKFIMTPMRDSMGWQVCWKVFIRESEKTLYMPLNGFDGLKGGEISAR